MVKKKKVVVAMSGGVDSSVAAALLKKEGFEVVGVFMKFWGNGKCCTPESEKRARLVCEKLGIPFYVFNFSKEFKKEVVDYSKKQEELGLTPNPCVICNKEIKFGLFLKKASSLGADYIATGHYARIQRTAKNGQRIKLLRGKDKNKDQSYFLWKLDKKILKYLLFPVGGYAKSEVIQLAKKFELPVLDIPESQDVCFSIKHIKTPGPIKTRPGLVLGEHGGLWGYTIGQRKGIGLAGGPYYVLDKDIKKNQLIVTKNEKDLYQRELTVKNINWLGDVRRPNLKVMAQIRYRQNPVPAVIKKNKIIFDKPQKAITSGQSVVFYNKNQLIGGAIIL